MAELGSLTYFSTVNPESATAFSRSSRFTFESSYVIVTSFLRLSAVAVVTPLRSFRADSVRAAHPAQCQPETFSVSVFGAATAAVERPAARAMAAMSLFMALLGYPRGLAHSNEAPC